MRASCVLGDRFLAVARTPPQTMSVVEQSFGMYNIRIHRTVFELCVTEEEGKMNKIDILTFGFLDCVNCGIYRTDLAIE